MEALLFVYFNPISFFLFGACWGSFMNVVLYRYPLGKSVVKPASACPYCGTPIKLYDNIPVLSWFILGGKCRACKAPFSIRYALNEFLYGSIWAVCAFLWASDAIAMSSAAVAFTCLIPAGQLLIKHSKAPPYLLAVGLVGVGVHLGKLLLV